MMSKDQYLSMMFCQIQAFVFITLQIFFATYAVLKIGEYHPLFPSFSRGIFSHMKQLDQSCVSENITYKSTEDTDRLLTTKNDFCDQIFHLLPYLLIQVLQKSTEIFTINLQMLSLTFTCLVLPHYQLKGRHTQRTGEV